MTLVQGSTEKPVLNTRLHNRENRLPAVHASMENDTAGSSRRPEQCLEKLLFFKTSVAERSCRQHVMLVRPSKGTDCSCWQEGSGDSGRGAVFRGIEAIALEGSKVSDP